MAIVCDKCSGENKTGAKFCCDCGRSFSMDGFPGELSALKIGKKIKNRYEIIKLIKIGGMGAVYKVKDLHTNKIYALKELLYLAQEEGAHEEAISRFEREARILSELDHPTLPAVTDYFTVSNRYYLIMDFIEGKDLLDILSQKGSSGLPEDQVIDWAIQICDVLHYLHSRNPPVIYRDIKPSNIMIRDGDEKIYLVDFGIARAVEDLGEEEQITKTSIGTVGYVSPEQVRGKPEPRSDIYSLGATMYHLLRGKPPLPFTFTSLKKERPSISDSLNAIVLTAVRLEMSERFSDIIHMKKALLGEIEVTMPALTADLDETDIQLMNLKSDDKTSRIYAIRILSELKTGKAVPALLKIMEIEQAPSVRKIAVETLAGYSHKDEVKELLKKTLLEDPGAEVRAAAAKVISFLKDNSFFEVLTKALNDPSQDVRWRVITALGNLNNKDALNSLCGCLNTTSDLIREEAVSSIDKIAPDYLLSWKEAREKLKQKKEKKNFIIIGAFILILLALSFILIRFLLAAYNTQKADGYFEQGIKYINMKDPLMARKEFEKMLEISPGNGKAYYGLGLTYIEGKPEEAIKYFNMALKAEPEYVDTYFAMREVYLIKKDFLKIVTLMEKVVELAPENPYGYLFLGVAYYETGEYEKALKTFNYCSFLFPDSEAGIKAKDFMEKMKK